MKNKTHIKLLVLIVVLVSIPLTIYLAVTSQTLLRRATNIAEITLSPRHITPTTGGSEQIKITLDPGKFGVTGGKIVLDYDTGDVSIETINVPEPFLYIGPDPQEQDVTSFSILINPDAETIPRDTMDIATIALQFASEEESAFTLNNNATNIVGFNFDTETIVNLPIKQVTPVTISTAPTLCRINQCLLQTAITLDYEEVNKDGFNIHVSWDAAQDNSTYYKLYRRVGNPIPKVHTDEFHVTTTNAASYIDTNDGDLFGPNNTVYYDIDTYEICSQ